MTTPRTPTRTSQEQFDRQAKHYDVQWNTWSEESLAWMLKQAEPTQSDVVLDVATGTGFTALGFAPHVASVIGLDVSTGMLAQARQRAQEQGLTNATFAEGNAEVLPFSEADFDLVTCRIAPHHFLSVATFVQEVARVLKPGGRFVLADTTVPDDAPEVDAWQNGVEALRDPSHVRNYTPREWRHFIEAAGLTVERTDTAGGIPITLNDWILKAGCTPEQAAVVRQSFAQAPPAAIQAFQIASLPDGDTRFVWQRVGIKARR